MREFTSHVHEDVVRKYLVARLQDRRHSSARFEQLVPEEVEFQLSIAALVSDFNPSQASLFAKCIQKIR